ncbi:MAG: CerR family C-terminal domain-containing protein, partial [Gammaproteobacteria bacterium]|nr:CerR family C-terminal domain-containing protein [Gammaproteobacteria bacterium]
KGVSVRDLCAAANANVAAIQYHFGGKEGLYHAIFSNTLDEDEARFKVSMENITALVDSAVGDRTQLAVALDLYINSFFARYPFEEHKRWFSVLVMRELSFPRQGFDLVFERRVKPSQQVLAKIIAALNGVNANDESVKLQAHALNSTIMSVVVSRNILTRVMDWKNFTPQNLEQLSQVIRELMFNALALTPPQVTTLSGDVK